MRIFIAAFLGTLSAFGLVILGTLLMVGLASRRPPVVARGATLVQPVGGTLRDYPAPLRTPFQTGGESQTEILENLRKAAADARVARVVLKLSPLDAGFARCEEIRAAVHRVRAAGKPVVAWAPFMTPKMYAVAVACDSILMIPHGPFLFPGFSTTRFFYRNALDRLGIGVDIDRIESYKSAAEVFVRSEMSPEARAMSERLLADQVTAFRAVLEEERDLGGAAFDSLLAHPIRLAEAALEDGLIDGVAHWEDLVADPGGSMPARIVEAGEYALVDAKKLGLGGRKTIAVVHGEGIISAGKSVPSLPLGDVLGSESIIADLKIAARARDVAAIVLRLDTPGGDAWASDAIGREVERIKASKPVVVSMSDVCASGGYAVAYRASSIVALPGTVTGSIGSYIVKLNYEGLAGKLGLDHDGVAVGEHARLLSPFHRWTPEEARMIRDDHWTSYNDWIARIADARGLGVADVDSLARGRVWTGREALALKLVDRLGGLDVAVAEARLKAGLGGDEAVTVRHYPEPRSWITALLEGDEEILIQASAADLVNRWSRMASAAGPGAWALLEIPVP